MVRLNAATLATISQETENAFSLTCIRQPISLTAKASVPLGHGRFHFDRRISIRALRTGAAGYVVSPDLSTNAYICDSERWPSIKGRCDQVEGRGCQPRRPRSFRSRTEVVDRNEAHQGRQIIARAKRLDKLSCVCGLCVLYLCWR